MPRFTKKTDHTKPEPHPEEETMSSAAQREIKELREQVDMLTELFNKRAKQAGNSARKFVNAESNIIDLTSEDIARMAKKAGKTAREFVEHKMEDAEEVYSEVEDKIHKNPLQAVAVAVTGGLLLGLLLKK